MNKLLISLLFLSITIFPQFGSSGISNPVNVGTGMTGNTSSTGIYSLGLNPANLMNSEDYHAELVLLFPGSFQVTGGTNFMSLGNLKYYFGGVDGKARYLTDQDKTNFEKLFDNGGNIFFDMTTSLFAFTYKISPEIGAFGFSVNDVISAKATIPKSLPNIIFSGDLLNRDYLFNDAALNSSWLRYYNLSYARDLKEIKPDFLTKLAGGFSIKIVNGFYCINTERVNTKLRMNDDVEITGNADMLVRMAFSNNFNVNYDFDSTNNKENNYENNNYQNDNGNNNHNKKGTHISPFPEVVGSGLGFDFGFSAAIDNLSFSIAITDIGSVNWNKHTAEYSASGSIYVNDLTNSDQMDSLKDKIKGKGEYTGAFSTSLPTALRLGASYLLNKENSGVPGNLLLAFDYNQGFNDVAGNSVNPRISIGAEWKPMDWIPFIRTGFSFGGQNGFNWGLGLGFNLNGSEFSIATSDFQYVLSPSLTKRISIAMGSRWRF